jgi:hypothetical protein
MAHTRGSDDGSTVWPEWDMPFRISHSGDAGEALRLQESGRDRPMDRLQPRVLRLPRSISGNGLTRVKRVRHKHATTQVTNLLVPDISRSSLSVILAVHRLHRIQVGAAQ